MIRKTVKRSGKRNKESHSILFVRSNFLLLACLWLSSVGCSQADSESTANSSWQCEHYICPNSGGPDEKPLPSKPDSIQPVFNGIESISPVNAGAALLTWSPAVDAGSRPSDITYKIYVSDSYPWPYATENFLYGAVKDQTNTVVQLPGSYKRYYLSVRAVDNAGNSEMNTVVQTYYTPDLTPPAFGGISSAYASSPYSVLISWRDAVDNKDMSEKLIYLIYLATDPNNFDFSHPSYTVPPYANHQVTYAGLNPDTTYYILVRAKDAAGNTDENAKFVSVRTLIDLQRPSAQISSSESLYQAPDGTIFLSFIDTTATKRPHVLRRSPSGIWSDLGVINVCAGNCSSIQMTVMEDSDAPIALIEGNSALYVWQFSALTGWNDLLFPSNIPIGYFGFDSRVVTDANDHHPMVFYKTNFKIDYKKFDGHSWNNGTSIIQNVYAHFSLIPTGQNSSYYVSFYDPQQSRSKYGVWDLSSGYLEGGNLSPYIDGAFDPFLSLRDIKDELPVFFITEGGTSYMKKLKQDGILETPPITVGAYTVPKKVAVNFANGDYFIAASDTLISWNGSTFSLQVQTTSILDVISDVAGGVIISTTNNSIPNPSKGLWKIR